MAIFYCMLAGFQAVAIYLSYTLANQGKEMPPKAWGTCIILLTAGSIGAYEAVKHTSGAGDTLILLAYFISVGILFFLVADLTKIRSLLAGTIYFVITVVAQLCFWLLF